MRLISRSIAALLTVTLLLTGCSKEPPAPPDVVATVGDRMITAADFARYVERNAGSKPEQLAPAAASALLDQFIDEVLLSEHAAKQGIQFSTGEITAAVRNDPGSTIVEKTDELRRQRLLVDMSTKTGAPSESEIRQYYQDHAAEFRTDEQVHARQILLQSEEEAAKVEAALKSGKSFEEVSVQYSRAPNASRGGDIGFVGRGQLPKIFEDVLFSLEPGMVSPVIKTNSNYFHVFKVDQVRPAGVISLEMARPVIKERLVEDALRKAVDRLLSSAAQKEKITVFSGRLKFAYSGRHSTSE